MTISMHAATVPVFRRMLGNLANILKKAEAHAAAKKFEPEVLLASRLAPDMFPLLRQVQIACDFARGVPARLAGAEVLSIPDDHKTFADLYVLIDRTIAFADGFKPAQIDGSEAKEIVLRPGTPREKRFDGLTYALHYGLPHFYFHVTTAYALLRHNGVEVGKQDYIGAL